MIKRIVFLFFISILAGCVPHKDTLLLQGELSDNKSVTLQLLQDKPYRVQPNDLLSIKIKANEQKLANLFATTESGSGGSSESLYFDGYLVNQLGSIRIPVLGEVTVIGLTLDEIRKKIEKQLLDDYFKKEADIFVTIKLAGLRYTINGEVGSPGTKTVLQDKLTILEAIANAGDISTTGNRKEVTILRQFPYGPQLHTIDVTKANVLQSPYYFIQPNDYIYVKPLPQKSLGIGTSGLQSFTTILSILSIISTTFLLFKNL